MDQNLENLIRERAYEIWTSHGCVHGQADQQEATVACTFEDRQNARGRRLTPQSTARLHRPRTLLYGGREWEHCEGGAAAPALPGAALCSRLCGAFSRG